MLVPLVIRYPSKVPPRSVIRVQARLLDVAPAILSLAGVDRPAGFGAFEAAQGEAPIDLLRYLDSAGGADLCTFAFGDLHGRMASIRTQEFKLIIHRDESQSDELYRLSDDPDERVNVISQEPEVARRLKARLLLGGPGRGSPPPRGRSRSASSISESSGHWDTSNDG